MSNRKEYTKTISTKLYKEDEDILHEFEDLLLKNCHTKQLIFRAAILEYVKRFTDSEEMKNYVENIQFE
jgi:hypothetical protein